METSSFGQLRQICRARRLKVNTPSSDIYSGITSLVLTQQHATESREEAAKFIFLS